MPNTTLTLLILKKAGACEDQRKLFKAKFGNSVIVTVELAESVAFEFSWDWAASRLLSSAALAEYNRIVVEAWVEYDRAAPAAWTQYKRVMAATWARLWLQDSRRQMKGTSP